MVQLGQQVDRKSNSYRPKPNWNIENGKAGNTRFVVAVSSLGPACCCGRDDNGHQRLHRQIRGRKYGSNREIGPIHHEKNKIELQATSFLYPIVVPSLLALTIESFFLFQPLFCTSIARDYQRQGVIYHGWIHQF